jgi:4-diphosphocytidyl-2-C-methyl-D-erythritol kinase
MISTAQAKLNLTLEVLKKRPDGYHEIKSVVQTISFLDKINIQPANNIEVNCSIPEWSYKDSLVARAVNLMKSMPGAAGKGAKIQIEKKIPLSSGLGGDSSDAAAVMRGLNLVWDMGLSLKNLIGMGVKLGTDIPLFFYGGTLLLEGRGEIIRPLKPMPHMTVILLFPDIPKPENKTMHLYSQITVRDYTDGRNTLNFMNTIEGRSSGQSRMFNVFDETAVKYFKGLGEYKRKFLEAGAQEVHVAGSGPALFSLTRDDVKAFDIQKKLTDMGLETHLADF